MKYQNIFAAVLAIAVGCKSSSNNSEKEVFALNSYQEKISYSLGLSIASNIKQQFDSVNIKVLSKGIEDSYGSTQIMTEEEAKQLLQAYLQNLQQAKMVAESAKEDKFMKENEKQEGVVTLPSGLQYKIIKEGTGTKPKSTDKVTAHYHGTLTDGTVFDSSVERGEPISFPVTGVIQGWQEALQLMNVGSKWKLFIPSQLGYGPRGQGSIPPNATLIFEVELLKIDN